jgi:hypothetical protein
MHAALGMQPLSSPPCFLTPPPKCHSTERQQWRRAGRKYIRVGGVWASTPPTDARVLAPTPEPGIAALQAVLPCV